jgi:hypothetical protein
LPPEGRTSHPLSFVKVSPFLFRDFGRVQLPVCDFAPRVSVEHLFGIEMLLCNNSITRKQNVRFNAVPTWSNQDPGYATNVTSRDKCTIIATSPCLDISFHEKYLCAFHPKLLTPKQDFFFSKRPFYKAGFHYPRITKQT